MSDDPYRWPDSTDILGQLRDADARIARVQALMDECHGSYASDADGGAPLRNYVLIAELLAALDGTR